MSQKVDQAVEEGHELLAFSGNIELKNKELEAFIDSLGELCKKYARDGSEYNFKFA